MNDVHDVQYLRNLLQNSQFITDITALKTFLIYFERLSRRNIKKSERNNTHYCESVFLVVIILAKFRPIEFLRSNRKQLHYVHFAYSPFFYLIFFRILIYSTNIFYFYFFAKILYLILHFLPDFFQYVYLYLQTF